MKFRTNRYFISRTVFALFIVAVFASYRPGPPELYDIEVREVWIPMPDDTRLAADLYLPKTDKPETFPVLLEYLPYRKDEGRKLRYSVFSYFVQRGYIVARVDIRGPGMPEDTIKGFGRSNSGKLFRGIFSKRSRPEAAGHPFHAPS